MATTDEPWWLPVIDAWGHDTPLNKTVADLRDVVKDLHERLKRAEEWKQPPEETVELHTVVEGSDGRTTAEMIPVGLWRAFRQMPSANAISDAMLVIGKAIGPTTRPDLDLEKVHRWLYYLLAEKRAEEGRRT